MTAMIGRSPRRKEDFRLLTGRGRYADDNAAEGQLHAAFVTSPHAHAEIRAVASPPPGGGVHAVLTGADWLADDLGAIPHSLGFSSPPDITLANRDGSDRFVAPHFPLPADRARMVGEPVALVVAESPELARDAAERGEVDYARLPAAVVAERAARADAPVLWPERGSNVAIDADVNDSEATGRIFASATRTVSLRTALSRVCGVPMEPRSSLGRHGPDGRYTLVTTSGSIYRHKRELARLLRVGEDRVRVVIGDVGGSYGPRNALYPDQVLVLWAARRLGRPVKWTSSRTESMLTDYQARDLVVEAGLALDEEGRVLAFRTANVSNIGAYSASWIPLVKGIEISTCLYRPGAVSARAVGVQTNTAPTYPYRSAGRPEVVYAMERLMDMAAAETGVDRLEIRRRNLIPPDAMPRDNGFGMVFEAADYPAALERAAELSDWHGFEARRSEARERGLLRGIGIANYADLSTGYPREWTAVHVRPEGRVGMEIGTMATGQGHRTAFSQMLADVLEVSYDAVDVGYGDTDRLKDGGGSHSGRSMRMGAVVVSDAGARVVDRGRRIAAHVLEAAEDDIVYAKAAFAVAGTDRSLGLFEAAAAAETRTDLPEELRGPLREEADVHLPRAVIGSGCHVCEVEIDPETGAVSVVDWTAVDDVGRAINPMTLDGQTHGAVMQGVGQALMERCAHDPDSGQMAAATFMDYALPRAEDAPPFRTALIEIPSPSNPLGVKPGSEGGTAVSPAAVANAVVDALSEHGVRHVELPATPERVWRAIRGAGGNG